jgi:hypothetical protein
MTTVTQIITNTLILLSATVPSAGVIRQSSVAVVLDTGVMGLIQHAALERIWCHTATAVILKDVIQHAELNADNEWISINICILHH